MAFRPKDTQERILHRLKIAKGQLERVMVMVEEQDYCINILHQSQAIQKALKETDNVLLENHLNTCVSDAIKQGESKKAVEEIMEVFKKKN